MKTKYYIAYENYLCKFDYVNNTLESWQIDEHTLKCAYYIENCEDLNETFNFLSKTCKIPYTSIDEEKFNKILNDFKRLMEMQNKIIQMKMNYAKQVKEYLTNF